MYDMHIKNGILVGPEQIFRGDIYTLNGKIASISSVAHTEQAEQVIDAEGCFLFPGFIDPHSHLNDPGMTESEDFYTGTCSAAAGGITTVMEHPLTFPLPDSVEPFVEKEAIAAKKCVVDYCLFGACTPNNFTQIDDMKGAGAVAFKAFMPYSVEIPQVNDSELLSHLQNLAGKETVLTVHCENDAIINSSTACLITEGRVEPCDYADGRPPVAEHEAISRLGMLTQAAGGRAHVAHCSTAKGVEIVGHYRRAGVDISVETCIHYLTLHRDQLEQLSVFGVCNPPLRSENEWKRLWELLLAGEINFIGSDHAAYTFAEKSAGKKNVFKTPAGFTGIQSCFPLFFDQAVNKRKLSLTDFVKYSSTNAAKRYGIFPQKGILQPGADADMVIFDAQKSWQVTKDILFYKQKWTPFMNMWIRGAVEKTIVRGTVVYSNGQILVEPGFGRFVRKNKS